MSEASVFLDDVLKSIDVVRLFLPAGSEAAKDLGIAYEAVVTLRTISAYANPEDLRAILAERLGIDITAELAARSDQRP